jgi:hypothetical protein
MNTTEGGKNGKTFQKVAIANFYFAINPWPKNPGQEI